MSTACPMIVLIQEAARFFPDGSLYSTGVSALREIVIGAVLVLFLHGRPQRLLSLLRFRPQRLLPECR